MLVYSCLSIESLSLKNVIQYVEIECFFNGPPPEWDVVIDNRKEGVTYM